MTSKRQGTLIDDYNLKRGFWEAKDTHDDLEEEISKKIAKGYPLNLDYEKLTVPLTAGQKQPKRRRHR